jgi:hypothetical protein
MQLVVKKIVNVSDNKLILRGMINGRIKMGLPIVGQKNGFFVTPHSVRKKHGLRKHMKKCKDGDAQ